MNINYEEDGWEVECPACHNVLGHVPNLQEENSLLDTHIPLCLPHQRSIRRPNGKKKPPPFNSLFRRDR